jgi:hypothetical protein
MTKSQKNIMPDSRKEKRQCYSFTVMVVTKHVAIYYLHLKHKIVLIDLVGSGQSDLMPMILTNTIPSKHADLLDLIEELCLKMSCWSDIL